MTAHHCPGCGALCRRNPRSPWAFCGNCLGEATDHEGRRLRFANASASGGLLYSYDGEEWTDARAVICVLKSRPVLVQEARFGGVVMEPLTQIPANCTDLSRP